MRLPQHRCARLAAAVLALVALPSGARGAAEVHRVNLVLSGIPGSVQGGGFNQVIDVYNRVLDSRGIAGLDHVDFGWQFDGELRCFIKPNLAVSAGVGQIGISHSGEVFPRLQQNIRFKAEMSSVPIHAGLGYYLSPYVQGDFQARAFVGAGLLSLVSNKGSLSQSEFGTDSSTTLGNPRTPPNSFKLTGTNDAPGYYVEGGVHMWFPSRFSVMLGGYYRSARVDNLVVRDFVVNGVDQGLDYRGVLLVEGKPASMDFSGLGFRIAVGIGL